MDAVGDRVHTGKRIRPEEDPVGSQDTPWSPFVPKRQCLTPVGASTAIAQLNPIPHAATIDISKYLEAKSEIEKLKAQLAAQPAESSEREENDPQNASTVRFYLEKCRRLEQKLSQIDALKVENAAFQRSNAMLSQSLDDVNSKLRLLVADSSQDDVVNQQSLLRAEADKQVALARKQRDDATNRLQEYQNSTLSLTLRIEEKEDEVSELKTRLMITESALQTARAETTRLRESLQHQPISRSAPTLDITQPSSNAHSEIVEAMKLELDELRAMRPMIEILERDCQRIPELERQNDFLRLELTTAQSKRMNEDALQIQVDASAAIHRQLEETIHALTVQNVKFKEDAQSWWRTLETLGSGRSADEVLSFIVELQNENLALMEKVGSLEAQMKASTASSQATARRLKEFESMIFDLKTENASLEGAVAQRDAKVQITEREANGLRALLASYKMEDEIGGFDTQKSAQISALEVTLAERVDYSRKLEEEVQELKSEVLQLNKYAKRLSDEKSVLEKRAGSGEVDPTRCRVLHFAETPLDLLRQKDAETSQKVLQEKVLTLSEQLKVLESDTGSGMTRVDSAVYVQQQQELKLLRQKYQDVKVAMDRMKSATEVAIRRYMSSVWNVFGWKVDFEEKNRVKVRYKYWNDAVRASQAVLLFEYPTTLGQKGVNDQLEPFTLLDSPFSQSISTDLLDLLRRPNTLPLFIAKLTVHLFEMVEASKGQ